MARRYKRLLIYVKSSKSVRTLQLFGKTNKFNNLVNLYTKAAFIYDPESVTIIYQAVNSLQWYIIYGDTKFADKQRIHPNYPVLREEDL